MSKAAFMPFIIAHILLFAGCAPLPPIPPADAPVQQCLVCRYKRDFSCLTVPTTPGTPHLQRAGRTYWFCSENCRCQFQKHPQPYLPKS